MAKTDVTVVVPTYCEAGNIPNLGDRLFKALKAAQMMDVELIFVDDNSPDATIEACAKLSEVHNVRLITRTTERGLSSAVLRGFKEAKGSLLICMDADLQHPPESVPEMIRQLQKPGCEFVLGTRYGVGGGVSAGWPLHRRIISWGARLLARPLSPLSDPMSGFFGVQRAVLDRAGDAIDPIGYKIALEIFVKARVRSEALREVNFLFGTRELGESKLTGKVMLHYLLHLKNLYLSRPFLVVLLIVIAAAVAATLSLLFF